MKKKGSILIEGVISIAFILIIGSILFGMIRTLESSKEYRAEMDFYERVSYSIENEIKYNLTYDEINNLLITNNQIQFSLDENYFNFILSNKIINMNYGNGIIIKKLSSSEKKILELEVLIYNEQNKLKANRKFVKGEFN